MSLQRKTVRGIIWTLASQNLSQVLKFGITVILARILTPQDFGLVGMVAVFTGFASLFSELGFTAALVQQAEVKEEHLSTIFWINLAAGALITLLFIAVTPLIAGFYERPELQPILWVISLNFLLGSLNDVQTALVQRQLDFQILAYTATICILISGTVSIVMALSGFGVWSLVTQQLIYTVVEVIVLWRAANWVPKRVFKFTATYELLFFSSNLLGFNVFNYLVRNMDNLLIGKYIDAFSLGIYKQAYALMLLPTQQLTYPIGTVMFPALSQIRDDHEQVKKTTLLAMRVIGIITIPMMAGLFIISDIFVEVIFGPKWSSMVPILRILALVGIVQPIGATVGWIYQSQGRTDLMFRWGIFSGVVTLISFFIGIKWGVIGIAAAYAIRNFLILWYLNIKIPGKLIGLTFGEYLANLQGILFSSFIMCVAVYLCGLQIPASWSMLPALIIQVTVGVISYGLLAVILNLQAYRDLLNIINQYLLPRIRRGGKVD